MAKPLYRIIDPLAPRKAVDGDLGSLAEALLAEVQARTPVDTGRLRAGWRVVKGRNYAVRLLANDVPYARMVEFGTKNMPARPMVGPVIAAHRGMR